jgi:hypothetical protein
MKIFDWAKIITREVLSSDKKYIGHVDGLDNIAIIVKGGLLKPRIPRDKVGDYQEGRVILTVSEQDIKKQFGKESPGYFNDSVRN